MADLVKLEAKLRVKFKNINNLNQALVHRSYLNEDHSAQESNERLEFLGDSVLSLLVSTELYRQFPNYPEGKLTSLRSALVRAKTLSEIAGKLGFGDYLLMSRGEERTGGRTNKSLLADTFEAVLGAIYLDQGIETAKEFLSWVLLPLIPEIQRDARLVDYKSNLQEIIQNKTRISPVYEVISESGPDHDKTFVVGVYAEKELLARGEGKSKQEAEQEAARAALEKEAS